jgi:hypothetical protein
MASLEFLRGLLAVIGLAGFLIGLFSLLMAVIQWRRRRLQHDWSPVAGYIRAVEVREVFYLDGANQFSCDVSLDYVWQGQAFANGVLIEGGEHFLTRGEAEDFARNFALGQEETIFVNTGNPAQAVARLAKEVNIGRLLVGHGLFLAFAGMLVYQGWDRVRW